MADFISKNEFLKRAEKTTKRGKTHYELFIGATRIVSLDTAEVFCEDFENLNCEVQFEDNKQQLNYAPMVRLVGLGKDVSIQENNLIDGVVKMANDHHPNETRRIDTNIVEFWWD